MPFGRKRVGGYGTGRQRKLASLQLAHDAKASRVEYANEPVATTSSSTMPGMVPARMALSVSLISNISYVHYDNAYDYDLYTFLFYPNIVGLCGITITV